VFCCHIEHNLVQILWIYLRYNHLATGFLCYCLRDVEILWMNIFSVLF
jgi:hypothetical protein